VYTSRVLPLLAIGLLSASASANVILNPGFTGGNYNPTIITSAGGHGTNITNWGGYQVGPGTTTIQLTKGNAPSGNPNDNVAAIDTTNTSSGLAQVFNPIYSPINFSVQVFVEQGSVMVGLGKIGSAPVQRRTSVTGQWVTLAGFATPAENTNDPFNLIVIYSDQPNSKFYVDNVNVTPVPEPATCMALALGAGAMALRRRRAA
jgi:hypothetical protein